jgi:hypothetical protein
VSAAHARKQKQAHPPCAPRLPRSAALLLRLRLGGAKELTAGGGARVDGGMQGPHRGRGEAAAASRVGPPWRVEKMVRRRQHRALPSLKLTIAPPPFWAHTGPAAGSPTLPSASWRQRTEVPARCARLGTLVRVAGVAPAVEVPPTAGCRNHGYQALVLSGLAKRSRARDWQPRGQNAIQCGAWNGGSASLSGYDSGLH